MFQLPASHVVLVVRERYGKGPYTEFMQNDEYSSVVDAC